LENQAIVETCIANGCSLIMSAPMLSLSDMCEAIGGRELMNINTQSVVIAVPLSKIL